MKVIIGENFSSRSIADCLLVPFFEGEKGAENASNKSLPPEVQLAVDSKDFKGKDDEVLFVYAKENKELRIVLIGLGKEKEITDEKIRRSYGGAVIQCKKKSIKTINVLLISEEEEVISSSVEGMLLSNYSFNKYKTEKEAKVEEARLIGLNSSHNVLIDKLKMISIGVNFTRDLVNGNADDEDPQKIAEISKEFAKLSKKVKVNIFDKKFLEKEKMGLLLAVNKGSSKDPVLVQLEYKGDPSSKENTVLVGKGVTYDTGGLCLKPPTGMETMKDDMSGAAVVLGVMHAVISLKLKVNITGLIPLTENSIDANSYKVGDVHCGYSKKTVEIVNTDAEGRLILADALAYAAKNLNPTKIIDIATLTGAIGISLGDEILGMFSNDDKLAEQLKLASEKTGELLWRMPLHDGYKKFLKSKIADIKNCGERVAGSITAALFLKEFIQDYSWAHLDIATTAATTKPQSHQPYFATGVGVRLLVELFSQN